MSQHTPTPWFTDRQDHDEPVSDFNAEQNANADHIVRCVNSYDDMLAALQAVQIVDRLNVSEWNAAMRLVDAAIAKATGGQP